MLRVSIWELLSVRCASEESVCVPIVQADDFTGFDDGTCDCDEAEITSGNEIGEQPRDNVCTVFVFVVVVTGVFAVVRSKAGGAVAVGAVSIAGLYG